MTRSGRTQALDKILATQPLTVPTLLVAGQWDQEDIYGAPAVFAALEPQGPDGTSCPVARPLVPRQAIERRHRLGPIHWERDTAA